MYFAVVRTMGGPEWVQGSPLREQPLWSEHARFMNALAEEGFVVVGGPVGGANRALLIIDAESEEQIRDPLAADPWSRHSLLQIAAIHPWQVLLGGLPGQPHPGARSEDLFIFARFHARQGQEAAVAAALREVIGPSRAEPGCRAIGAYAAARDARLFWIHSRWAGAAAFDTHAHLPHTVRFLEQVQPLIDHELDVTRARPL